MNEGYNPILKGLLVVIALALSKERLINVGQIDQMILVSAMTALTLVLPRERFINNVRGIAGVKQNINKSLIAIPATAENTLNKIQSTLPQLTKKEADLLNLISKGSINKEISKKLGVSDTTVKKYLKSILRKLNANLTSNVTVNVVRHGFVNFIHNLNYYNYHKGSMCFCKPILCQEGWCSDCAIYRENVIEFNTSVR